LIASLTEYFSRRPNIPWSLIVPDQKINYFFRSEENQMANSPSVSLHPCICNKRSGEVHKDGCPWARLMSPKNKIRFNSVLEAQSKGYNNGCEHCFRELSVKKGGGIDSELSVTITNFKPEMNRGEVINLLATKTNIPEGKSIAIQFWGTIFTGAYELMGTVNTNSIGEAEFPFTIPMNVPAGRSYFKAVLTDGSYALCNGQVEIPNIISSYSADPTTFKQSTTIHFTTVGYATIKVEIYNNLGMKRRTLISKYYENGDQKIKWDGKNSSDKVFKYATKGEYQARIIVSDLSGSTAEEHVINLKKTQWRP